MGATRYDISSWLPGATLYGNCGFGWTGADIKAVGGSPLGYLDNDITLPADAAVEICGRITAWPSGTLVADEYGGVHYTGAASSFTYALYADGVYIGPDATALVTAIPMTNVTIAAVETGTDTALFAANVSAPDTTAVNIVAQETGFDVFTASLVVSNPPTPQSGGQLPGKACFEMDLYPGGSGGSLGSFKKQPHEVHDYDVRYDAIFAERSDTPVSVEVFADPGVNVVQVTLAGTGCRVVVSGGDEARYKVTLRLTSSSGIVLENEFYITVREN